MKPDIIINVKPTPTSGANSIRANVSLTLLHRGLQFNVERWTGQNAGGLLITRDVVWLEGDDYKNWPTGDEPSTYITDFLLGKLGLESA